MQNDSVHYMNLIIDCLLTLFVLTDLKPVPEQLFPEDVELGTFQG